jgi:hypothetical protein
MDLGWLTDNGEIYHLYKENGANQEHLIEKIPVGGSRVETERRKGA